MSTLAANNITDAAGTGGPTLANGLTIGTSVLAAPSGSAPSYTCRAWINFDGTTSPINIREDGNISSVTDNGTGDYTLNFATAMSDVNYVVVGSHTFGTANFSVYASKVRSTSDYATGSVRVLTPSATSTANDYPMVNFAIFR